MADGPDFDKFPYIWHTYALKAKVVFRFNDHSFSR